MEKMGRGMAVVRHCKKFMPSYLIKQLIQALVLSYLDYCAVIWSNTTQSNLYKLQVAQNKAARIALNCSYRTSSTLMHNKLIWLDVKSKLHYILVTFIKNVIINKIPEVLYNKLTFFSNEHMYCTRQASEGRFRLPPCRTNVIKGTVLYRAMVAWNLLPSFLISDSNRSCFNKKLKMYLFTYGLPER